MVNPEVIALTKQFKKRLCNSDSCPSDGSLRTYSYSILWLKQRMDFPEDGSMPSVEDVLEYMENAKVDPSKKCRIFTALKKWHGCHGDKCSCEKYGKPLVEAKIAVDTQYAKQKRTTKQNKNWVDFPVLKKFASELRDEVLQYDKNQFWEKEQYIKATLAFILLFHMKYPVRRDLATVRWGKKEWSETDNYIDSHNKSIVLQKYKTARWMGKATFQLTRTMWRIWGMLKIQQQKRDYKAGYVLLNKFFRPMTPNGYSTWLAREMKRCPTCEKKAVGCMLLRHCCITWERRHEKTLHEKEEYAKKCLHSVAQNNLYRVHE